MNNRRLWLSAGIISCVIVIAFVLSVPHTRDLGVKQSSPPETVPAVSLHDSFKKGAHTITGSLTVANACTNASADASLAGEGSESAILVALTLVDDGGLCLQVPTPINFQTTIVAPVSLPITVTVNGSPASTTPS